MGGGCVEVGNRAAARCITQRVPILPADAAQPTDIHTLKTQHRPGAFSPRTLSIQPLTTMPGPAPSCRCGWAPPANSWHTYRPPVSSYDHCLVEACRQEQREIRGFGQQVGGCGKRHPSWQGTAQAHSTRQAPPGVIAGPSGTTCPCTAAPPAHVHSSLFWQSRQQRFQDRCSL